ncbi:MAG TPA: copper homeostasis protein CutC [Planctomycetota bacterium]|nr:copper homeostasis protein CutC [Planctomycetota bacterium]
MPSGPIVLEVAVDDVASAAGAARAGAHRIELCAALALDGLTPEPAVLGEALARTDAPVFAMVRPRPGDFTYDPREVDAMVRAVERARTLGAAGIVTGCLTAARSVDRSAMATLLAAAAPLPVTFHRAFDLTADPFAALDVLVELGCARVLTAGGAKTAADGAATLRALVARAADRLVVVAGGGVRADNLPAVLASGVREVHAGPRVPAGHDGPRTDLGAVAALVAGLAQRRMGDGG